MSFHCSTITLLRSHQISGEPNLKLQAWLRSYQPISVQVKFNLELFPSFQFFLTKQVGCWCFFFRKNTYIFFRNSKHLTNGTGNKNILEQKCLVALKIDNVLSRFTQGFVMFCLVLWFDASCYILAGRDNSDNHMLGDEVTMNRFSLQLFGEMTSLVNDLK